MLSTVKNKQHVFTSLNDLMISALKDYLRMMRRAEVDAGFAEMANDPDFQRETEQIMKEFEYADAEAFRLIAKKP